MEQTALTQGEIEAVFDQLDLRNEIKRAERIFSSFYAIHRDEVSGVIQTRTTNCNSDQ